MNWKSWHYDLCSSWQQKIISNNQILPNTNQNFPQNKFPQNQPFLNMNNPFSNPYEYCKKQHKLLFSMDGIGY